MDDSYNFVAAAKKLAELASKRSDQLGNTAHMLSTFKSTDCIALKCYNPSAYKIANDAEREEDAAEIIVHIHGILTGVDLLPIKNIRRKTLSNKVNYLRQSVSICGFGDPNFEGALDALEKTFQSLSRNLPQDSVVRNWSRGCPFNDQPTLDIGNRIFTHRADAQTSGDHSFSRAQDPTGHLAALKGSKFIHTKSNQVTYAKWMGMDNENEKGIVEINPETFKIGDIVELTLSMTCVQVGKDKGWKMLPVLKGVVLLDTSERERSVNTRSQEHDARTKRTTSRKRKGGDIVNREAKRLWKLKLTDDEAMES